MFPLYVPTPNEFELTITVNGFNGVAPVPTLVDSQLPPLLVVATTVNDTPAEPEPLLTLKVWLAGLAPVSHVGGGYSGDHFGRLGFQQPLSAARRVAQRGAAC